MGPYEGRGEVGTWTTFRNGDWSRDLEGARTLRFSFAGPLVTRDLGPHEPRPGFLRRRRRRSLGVRPGPRHRRPLRLPGESLVFTSTLGERTTTLSSLRASSPSGGNPTPHFCPPTPTDTRPGGPGTYLRSPSRTGKDQWGFRGQNDTYSDSDVPCLLTRFLPLDPWSEGPKSLVRGSLCETLVCGDQTFIPRGTKVCRVTGDGGPRLLTVPGPDSVCPNSGFPERDTSDRRTGAGTTEGLLPRTLHDRQNTRLWIKRVV